MLPTLFSPAPRSLHRLGRSVTLALSARCLAAGAVLALLAMTAHGLL